MTNRVQRDGIAVYILAALLGCAIAAVALHLWHADLTIPMYYAYAGDALGQAAIAKNFTDGGSIYSFPHLAAPIGGILYDFPTLSVLHLTIERVLLLITGNSYVALNLLFLLAFPLTTMTALYALRRMGAMMTFAFPLAGLYTALPARFDRNEGHLFYATYWLLPLAVLVCVLIARGSEPLYTRATRMPRPTRTGLFAAAVGVAIGADNQYHGFFVILFLVVAACLALLRTRRWDGVLSAAALSAIIAATIFVQLIPAFAYHAKHGANPAAFERYPEESMTYGLHIAEVLLPVAGHRIGKLAAKREYYDARSGLAANESSWSSYGLVGALGFLALIGVLFVRIGMAVPPDLESLAIFNLAGVLTATVGGFGTLFNFFVRPEIRAYNRISTLLAFLALAAVALICTSAVRRYRPTLARGFSLAIMIVLIVGGVFDQTTARMIPPYAADTAIFHSDETFVAAIERALPRGAAVYELPWVRYPESAPAANLDPENLFRPYLHAAALRFSYGAVDGRDPQPWEARIAALPVPSQLEAMVLGGFQGAIVFRAGYADGGAAVETALRALTAAPIVSPDGTLAFYTFAPLAKRAAAADPRIATLAFQQHYVSISEAPAGEPLPHAVDAIFAGGGNIAASGIPLAEYPFETATLALIGGCSQQEATGVQRWFWCGPSGTFSLTAKHPGMVRFTALASTPGQPRSAITVRAGSVSRTISSGPAGAPLILDLKLDPANPVTMTFKSAAAALPAPGDARVLVLRLDNVAVEAR